ncbi:MAG: PIN/TRAM domain-containing protein [Candidatus Brocadiia bacterium]
MTLWVLRLFFLLVCAGAGWSASQVARAADPFWGILLGIVLFIIVFAMEAFFTDKESVANLVAVVFGITIGFLLSAVAIHITTLVLQPPTITDEASAREWENTRTAIRIILTAMLCYLCTVIVFRTRDRFRFVIPYTEFKREQKGPRAFLLDTSAIIDGRIAAVCRTGFIETPIFIPTFVLEELHGLADSSNHLKRVRGRRGLELVNQLQRAKNLDVSVYEADDLPPGPVDSKLLQLARELDAHVCTTDFNLNKVAQAQGVPVLNLNDLANALKPSVIPGETLPVRLIRRGEEQGQAVGFLDDGTMVVVEEAEEKIGNDVTIEITRVLQKSSGRLIFGRLVA